jgi:hypothetical protein
VPRPGWTQYYVKDDEAKGWEQLTGGKTGIEQLRELVKGYRKSKHDHKESRSEQESLTTGGSQTPPAAPAQPALDEMEEEVKRLALLAKKKEIYEKHPELAPKRWSCTACGTLINEGDSTNPQLWQEHLKSDVHLNWIAGEKARREQQSRIAAAELAEQRRRADEAIKHAREAQASQAKEREIEDERPAIPPMPIKKGPTMVSCSRCGAPTREENLQAHLDWHWSMDNVKRQIAEGLSPSGSPVDPNEGV